MSKNKKRVMVAATVILFLVVLMFVPLSVHPYVPLGLLVAVALGELLCGIFYIPAIGWTVVAVIVSLVLVRRLALIVCSFSRKRGS